MSYGTPEWDSWVLGEEESLKMIKAAYIQFHLFGIRNTQHQLLISYDAGINTFDTANVCFCAV